MRKTKEELNITLHVKVESMENYDFEKCFRVTCNDRELSIRISNFHSKQKHYAPLMLRDAIFSCVRDVILAENMMDLTQWPR